MRNWLRRFLKDETGVTSIEYALIATLISIAVILGATTLGTKLNSTFNAVSTKINGPAS
ncbi:MAG TPA: Flp family type IVb pilin [Bauldia sp.]|nr:Flp family type IVb pilin [Bauldia sp.]